MSTDIRQQIKLMPKLPGCYQYFDKTGEIIYIGKAKNLYNRVNSYFIGKKDSPKLQVMVPQIVRVECIVVNSEVEALILESELIKKYKPKYNILLKDDKKFPYFLITNEAYPRITVVRKANKNMLKDKYFGPYTDSRAMYCTLETLGKIFPLKKCKTPKFKSRPCLYYDIGQCCAPCQKLISSEDYKKILKDVELFLSGRQNELLKVLEAEMKRASENLEFEKAARYRDSYNDIQKTMEKQKVVSENTRINQDYIGIVKSESMYCATILQVRQGRLINKKDFTFSHIANTESNDVNEIIQAVLREYYAIITDTEIPTKITLPQQLDDVELYEKWLGGRLGKSVKISEAKSQRDKEMLLMAQNTAEFNLEQAKLKELSNIQNDYNDVGTYLMEKLNLRKFPHTIECYDISHIQGTNTVASGVYFENGMSKKSKYRKYKLRTIEKGEVDDFKSMREILTRRFKRIKKGEIEPPDLIIIDGGKGQLSSVVQVMKEMELDLDIVSLAKREEEVFLPNCSTPVILALNSPALHLFQRIRDEAHRFAITFHRQLRSKNMTR